MTGAEFTERVRYTALAWLPARDLVLNALKGSKGTLIRPLTYLDQLLKSIVLHV